MSTTHQDIPSAFLSDNSRGLKKFWHLPALTVARFTLMSYMRSGWILGDIVFIWLLYAIFFYEFGGNVAYFFGTAGQGMGAETLLGTVILVQRAMNARVYLPLSRLTSRPSYIRGLVIATCVLRIPLFLMLLLLASLYHHFSPPPCTGTGGIGGCIAGATFANIIIGSIGLLANCFVIATLIVALSAPIATRRIQIAALSWFAAVLYSNTTPGIVAQFLSFTRIPLVPVTMCYSFGTTGSIDWNGAGGLLLVVLYIVGLTLLAQYWMSKRDLLLQ